MLGNRLNQISTWLSQEARPQDTALWVSRDELQIGDRRFHLRRTLAQVEALTA
jgi:hypothetical protein